MRNVEGGHGKGMNWVSKRCGELRNIVMRGIKRHEFWAEGEIQRVNEVMVREKQLDARKRAHYRKVRDIIPSTVEGLEPGPRRARWWKLRDLVANNDQSLQQLKPPGVSKTRVCSR